MKLILFIHRYLGVAVGLLMVLWCLSGFVMMYQGWPRVAPEDRIQGLPPLGSVERRALSDIPIAEDAALNSFRVESLAGTPVLRTSRGIYNLHDGAELQEASQQDARSAALAFAAAHGFAGAPDAGELAGYDQWTIQERRSAPFWRFRFDGPDAAIVYVSTSGEVAQATTGRERFWTWLGAIPHWLYPRMLREHAGTWTQVVIWTSALGVFLTVTGLYVGIVRFRRRPNGSWSPYRKVWMWHHYTGLAFGVFTLTWVFSGLLTMGPFWPMQSRPFPEAYGLAGQPAWSEARPVLEAALARPDAADMVQIESAPLGGAPFLLARYADGRVLRLGEGGAEAPLGDAEIRDVFAAAGGPLPVADLELLEREDAYYYGHHRTVELPVWRARTREDSPRLLYLSAQSGRLLRAYDGGSKAHRWLESGLHSFDFPGLRNRPVWDVVVLTLLAGVTLLCAIGVWLSWERVRRDFRFLTRKRRGKARRRAATGG